MQVRYTRSIGLPVIEEDTGEALGSIAGALLNPDTGAVEGFFVRGSGFFSPGSPFLLTADILHWGIRVTVRDRDSLSSIDDLVRLRALLESGRPMLGQRIVTESGRPLGRCEDVQFTTKDFRLQWIFPRRFWRRGVALPASQILEVRRDAIVVRDSVVPAAEEKADDALAIIPALPEAA